MRVSARTEESLRPIFVQEAAILGWTLDRDGSPEPRTKRAIEVNRR